VAPPRRLFRTGEATSGDDNRITGLNLLRPGGLKACSKSSAAHASRRFQLRRERPHLRLGGAKYAVSSGIAKDCHARAEGNDFSLKRPTCFRLLRDPKRFTSRNPAAGTHRDS